MGGRSYWKKVPLPSACSPKEYEDTLAKTKHNSRKIGGRVGKKKVTSRIGSGQEGDTE